MAGGLPPSSGLISKVTGCAVVVEEFGKAGSDQPGVDAGEADRDAQAVVGDSVTR